MTYQPIHPGCVRADNSMSLKWYFGHCGTNEFINCMVSGQCIEWQYCMIFRRIAFFQQNRCMLTYSNTFLRSCTLPRGPSVEIRSTPAPEACSMSSSKRNASGESQAYSRWCVNTCTIALGTNHTPPIRLELGRVWFINYRQMWRPSSIKVRPGRNILPGYQADRLRPVDGIKCMHRFAACIVPVMGFENGPSSSREARDSLENLSYCSAVSHLNNSPAIPPYTSSVVLFVALPVCIFVVNFTLSSILRRLHSYQNCDLLHPNRGLFE